MKFPSYSATREARISRFNLSDRIAQKALAKDRCFILGMGPSLGKVDPAALQGEFVIGTNNILKTEFVPDVVCVVDNRRFDFENLKNTQIKLITVRQIAERREEQIASLNAYTDIDYVDYGQGLTRDVLTISDFDERLSSVNFAGSVIADLAIPFACYLGFKEIYVLGLDGAAASFPNQHILANENVYAAAHPSHMFHLHEKTAYLAEKRGIKTFNASHGGVVFAFEKTPLELVLPAAVRRDYAGTLGGKIIALGTNIAKIIKVERGYRLSNGDGDKFVRHKNNIVFFDKDDGTAQFDDDARWIIEPSFVRPDWISLLSASAKRKYITAIDEFSGYKLRSSANVFSPYFSSFRVYDTPKRASQRIGNARMLRQIAAMKEAIGGAMIADDEL